MKVGVVEVEVEEVAVRIKGMIICVCLDAHQKENPVVSFYTP